MPLPKIDVPTHEFKMISDNKSVRFRPFLVKEQKLLLMASESQDTKETIAAVKQIVNNCVIDDIDVNTIPTFDLEYLFLNLRARSVGEVVNLNYKCNNTIVNDKNETVTCNSIEKFDINLLEIKPILNSEHNKKIELNSKLGIVMKYPTFETLANLENKSETDNLIQLLTECIDYIYDDTNIYKSKDSTKEELIEFIENLQQKDMEKIQLFFDTVPKLKHDINFKCKKCNYEEVVPVEGIQNFFI
jgi:uncharacterized protein (UPF0179 family)